MSRNLGNPIVLNASRNSNNQPNQLAIRGDISAFDLLPDKLHRMILNFITDDDDLVSSSLVCKKWFDMLLKEMTLYITETVWYDLFVGDIFGYKRRLLRAYDKIIFKSLKFDFETLPNRFENILKSCKNIMFDTCAFRNEEVITAILKACKNATLLNIGGCKFDETQSDEEPDNEILDFIWDDQKRRKFRTPLVKHVICDEPWQLLEVFDYYGIKVGKLSLVSSCYLSKFHLQMLEFVRLTHGETLKAIKMQESQDGNESNQFISTLFDWDGLQLESLRYITDSPNDMMSKLLEKQTSLKSLECEGSITLSNVPVGLKKLSLTIHNETHLTADHLVRFQNLISLEFIIDKDDFELNLSVIAKLPQLMDLKLTSCEEVPRIRFKDIPPMPNIRDLRIEKVEIDGKLAGQLVKAMPNLVSFWFQYMPGLTALPYLQGAMGQLKTLILPGYCFEGTEIRNISLPNLEVLQLLSNYEDAQEREKISKVLPVLAKNCPSLLKIFGYNCNLMFKRDFDSNEFKPT